VGKGTENVVAPGRKPDTVITAEGKKLKMPADWELLPPGDATLTRRTKAASPAHYVVQERKGRRVFARGVWAPKAIIDGVRAELEAERATETYAKQRAATARRRDKVQAEYVEDFTAAIRAYLAFAPRYQELADRLAKAVAEHATPIGSGTVARTKQIPVARRAAHAVTAWMRHQTTGYDSMELPRKAGERSRVRRLLAQRSKELLQRYRSGEGPGDDCPLSAALASELPQPAAPKQKKRAKARPPAGAASEAPSSPLPAAHRRTSGGPNASSRG
jgi:hypothetical protein